jgi:predicted dinucleotide-binding enzyme
MNVGIIGSGQVAHALARGFVALGHQVKLGSRTPANPLVFHEGGPPTLALGHTDSGGEQVQRGLPESRVVKAFDIVGNTLFFRPDLRGGAPTMFICGDDEEARRTVAQVVQDFGWTEVVDIGGIAWEHAVKMLHR